MKHIEIGQIMNKTKTTFYAPARITAEEHALSSGYCPHRYNIMDIYADIRYPKLIWLTDHDYYQWMR